VDRRSPIRKKEDLTLPIIRQIVGDANRGPRTKIFRLVTKQQSHRERKVLASSLRVPLRSKARAGNGNTLARSRIFERAGRRVARFDESNICPSGQDRDGREAEATGSSTRYTYCRRGNAASSSLLMAAPGKHALATRYVFGKSCRGSTRERN